MGAPRAGSAQMEGLWAGGKGQMRPFPGSQLPSQLPIVSHPLPPQRPSVISVRPRLQREPGQARVFSGLLVSGQVGRPGCVGGWAARGQEEGRWRGQEGGVRVYKSRPTALLFNTLLQRVVSETVN